MVALVDKSAEEPAVVSVEGPVVASAVVLVGMPPVVYSYIFHLPVADVHIVYKNYQFLSSVLLYHTVFMFFYSLII